MNRVDGTLVEPYIPGTVVKLKVGDIVFLKQQRIYAQIEGFKKLTNGNWTMRLAIPADNRHFVRWCRKNPHKVKRLTVGTLLKAKR